MRRRLRLTGRLTLNELADAANGPAVLELDEAALRAVERNRSILAREIDSGAEIYGITTGFGALISERLPAEKTAEAQVNLLRSHAAGAGAPLPREVVRGALIVRLNGLLQARSGVRPVVLERILALLNAGLVPPVPRTGSLGASGDLAPSAHAFLPLIGEGLLVDEQGNESGAAEAMRSAGIEPLRLEAKEALALINGTHFMAALAALVSRRIRAALDTADAAVAMSIHALLGSRSALDPRVHALRNLAGQERSAANIAALVGDSEPPAAARPLQDAYSLRCSPQVHGAARELSTFFDQVATADVNAVTDNPLVFDERPRIVSAGNFHGQALALAFDSLRVAMADLASISDRRTFRLLSPSLNNGLPSFLTLEAGIASGYMVAQYTGAALLSELRALAHPVSCDSVPTSDSQEDHVSMGMTAATMALEAVQRLETVLAIELVCAAQALDFRASEVPPRVAAIHDLLRSVVPKLDEDRPPASDIAAAATLVRAGDVARLVPELGADAIGAVA